MARGRPLRAREFDSVEETIRNRFLPEVAPESPPILKTPEDAARGSPLFWDMTEEAVILYDRDCFLQELLTGVKARLEALGARRVNHGSAWYWVLKENYQPGEVFEI